MEASIPCVVLEPIKVGDSMLAPNTQTELSPRDFEEQLAAGRVRRADAEPAAPAAQPSPQAPSEPAPPAKPARKAAR